VLTDFIAFIAKHLVEHPEEVQVTCSNDEKADTYTLTVPKEDLGRIIGKKGHTIKAMRALANAVSARHGKRCSITVKGLSEPDE